MLRAALRDLQWRWKRFVIAIVGVALVFAMGLIMTGFVSIVPDRGRPHAHSIGAERWAVAADASGPFNSFSPIATRRGSEHRWLAADGASRDNSRWPDRSRHHRDGRRAGRARLAAGVAAATSLTGSGQIVVDRSLPGASVGDTISFGGQHFHVVGTMSGQSLFAGIPLVYISLADAQEVRRGGPAPRDGNALRPDPDVPPAELKVMTNGEVKDDVLRPLTAARSSIGFVRLLLWLVAAIVIGSVLYLQALERTRDFAVFKATGTSTAAIGAGLALQAVMLSLAAAVLAAVLATVLAPLFPLDVEIPASGYLLLPVVTVVVGLLASSIALRRTARVDPAIAFGG